MSQNLNFSSYAGSKIGLQDAEVISSEQVQVTRYHKRYQSIVETVRQRPIRGNMTGASRLKILSTGKKQDNPSFSHTSPEARSNA
jgi:hypothetical protein